METNNQLYVACDKAAEYDESTPESRRVHLSGFGVPMLRNHSQYWLFVLSLCGRRAWLGVKCAVAENRMNLVLKQRQGQPNL